MYRRVSIPVPNGKKPLYYLERRDKVLYEELKKEIKRNGTYTSSLNNVEQAIIANARGFDLPPDRRKSLLHREFGDEEHEYKAGRIRVFAFDDGDAEVIVNGIAAKRKEEADPIIDKMREMKVEYFDLKESGKLITIDTEGRII